MSLSITTTDSANNSGMVATIAGSDGGSTNNVYASPVFQGNNPLAWTLVGTRTGDGTVNLPVTAGYYFVYTSGAVSSVAALSPPVIGLASIAILSMQDQVELAIQAKIQTLTLNSIQAPMPSIPASRVYRFDTPMSDELLAVVQTPCVIVCPAIAPESIQAVVNSRDDIGWPVNVLVLAQFAERQQGMSPSVKRWREQIFRAIRYQRLLSVPEIQTVIPEPQPILQWRPSQLNYCYSAITFRAVGRDYRGV